MPTLFASKYSQLVFLKLVFVNASHLPKTHKPMHRPKLYQSACKANAVSHPEIGLH